MKTIAFYLPQFHEIPENDLWWGKGFTEWTNVKKAKPRFLGHYQPRAPLQDYYYNLLNLDVHKWQINLAKQYGLDGFCYYHYWFKGKKLLEKPLELRNQCKEIDFPYCLCWANESWTRSWDGKDQEVLMRQEYGDESDWKEHFNYLLPFFKNKNYLNINDKPIFVIYRPASIPNLNKMLGLWNEWAQSEGLLGIHFVEMLTIFEDKSDFPFDAAIEFEPMYTLKKLIGNTNSLHQEKKDFHLSYDFVWKRILNRQIKERENIYKGAFVDWDNSPRRKESALIMKGANPDKFKKYLLQHSKDTDFLFINAWNEWAEGTYLEPDEKYGYKYLEALMEIKKSHF
ncbi:MULTISPECIES: glycosyltransferase WbsX family protein [Bacillus cereus group]|uniref:glycosyltransferase WbsX family protein n=1 Tax=Bacillus cereus group TaxID=86661 RepID=UPI000BEC3FFD|nr:MULTISPECIES: glycoside hydrolase family 99-like domain-containing protein [Bacillus cereus group]MBJ7967348.1 glycoside hydrolase family 99-like domain-containing protein [Bacillus cereus]MBJ8003802.1 glycoside hydrolase family 99-like domain-containing protein [Bacillus cereus]PDY97335.1 glycosyl transferase [Bacillus thuringiensis]PGV49660.1 glycosyl transferase [Bacillus thuringiensis]